MSEFNCSTDDTMTKVYGLILVLNIASSGSQFEKESFQVGRKKGVTKVNE